MPVVPTPAGVPFDLWWAPGARPLTIPAEPDTLFALEQGEGPPVLLLHGYTCELTHFRYQLPALAQAGFRAIALDLPGHGHARKADGPHDAKRFVDAVVATLDHLEIPRASLVGHSMGGAIALALAAHHPARVDKVALLAPYAPRLPLGKGFELWVNRLCRVPGLPGLLLKWQSEAAFHQSNAAAVREYDRVLSVDGGRWRSYAWEMFNVPGMREAWALTGRAFVPSWRKLLPALPRLDARGLVLWGDEDRIVLATGLPKVVEATGARGVVLEQTGHAAHFERPERVNAELLAFLKS